MSHDVSALGRSVPVQQPNAKGQPAKQAPAQKLPETSMAGLVPMLRHTVQAGETLTSIAQKYAAHKPADMDQATWIQTLQVLNGLGDRDVVKVGQVLSIPQLVANGEVLETTPTPEGPYNPEQGLTFPNGGTAPRPAKPTTGTASGSASSTSVTAAPSSPPLMPLETWRSQVVTQAKDSLGTRYVWGGTNLDKGVDCSGLTQQVFDGVGVELPRSSSAQFKAGGKPVAREQLQPGDLVFFRNTKGSICHVGIVSGKDDKGRQLYISATTSKGVAEVAIDDWTKRNPSQRYAGARRFEAPKPSP